MYTKEQVCSILDQISITPPGDISIKWGYNTYVSKEELFYFIEKGIPLYDISVVMDTINKLSIGIQLPYEHRSEARDILKRYSLDWKYFGFLPYEEYCNKEKKIKTKEKKNKNKWNMIGYVYFIQDDDGSVKIGKTINIKSRYSKYITENKSQMRLIGYIKTEDYTKEESIWHEKYKDKLIRGERYNLSKKDIDYIKTFIS